MSFHLHITAITADYEKDLVHRLIKKGYTIAPASDQSISIQSSDQPTALISLQVDHLNDITARSIYDDLLVILNDMTAKYHSIVISPFARDSIWGGSNISNLHTTKHVLN